jgi:polysaccharide export outer membrane protein
MCNRVVTLFFCLFVVELYGRQAPSVQPANNNIPPIAKEGHLDFTPPAPPPVAPSNYVLGVEDQITLSVLDLPEVTAISMRIDQSGEINVPMAGRVHAAGLTINELQVEIEKKLTEFVWSPHALITITDIKSQPVTLLGEITTPGIRQLTGHKTLFDMISTAGGLRPDAGSSIRITRDINWGRIPLPGAQDDPTGHFSTASIPTKSIGEVVAPEQNIVLMPNDIVTVSKAEMVYVIGSVNRPGGFVLGQDQSISAMKALVLAYGLGKGAAGHKAHITRTDPNTMAHVDIRIDLRKLMSGKIQDVLLKSNDVLYVPSSMAGSILTRTAEAGITLGTQLAIYHF